MKTIVRIFTITLGIMIVNQACSKIFGCHDEAFTFSRVENNTNKLRLDGYYYAILSFDSTHAHTYTLYENGIFHDNGGVDTAKVFNNTVNLQLPESAYNHKTFWGIYNLENDNITIQRWIPLSNGCVKVIEEEGVILNDTTFRLDVERAIWYGEVENETSINRIFHFNHYLPKPDSIVSFIRSKWE